MKYYKVKPENDNKHTRAINGKWNGYFHIANELLTEKEIEKYGYIKEYCDPVEISKNNICWFFGARFEKESFI